MWILKIFFFYRTSPVAASACSTKTVFYKNRWSSQEGCSTKKLFFRCSKNCLFLFYGSSRPEEFCKKGVLGKGYSCAGNSFTCAVLRTLLIELQFFDSVPEYQRNFAQFLFLPVILRNFYDHNIFSRTSASSAASDILKQFTFSKNASFQPANCNKKESFSRAQGQKHNCNKHYLRLF